MRNIIAALAMALPRSRRHMTWICTVYCSLLEGTPLPSQPTFVHTRFTRSLVLLQMRHFLLLTGALVRRSKMPDRGIKSTRDMHRLPKLALAETSCPTLQTRQAQPTSQMPDKRRLSGTKIPWTHAIVQQGSGKPCISPM
ncbi:hypothetical protein K461DRAFT_111048 [Myriangium duriaei CBS 260.36]|uniref:Uncharacterized protein n=1 Tax=Myriangium duriaei CBS 260.36 TaxID=1168546 RepID=A0A9P4MHW7_9PEZI|nr:hypothetical protein K461DRAFT_111048 [Myriangium duriaei CBS 260.36]